MVKRRQWSYHLILPGSSPRVYRFSCPFLFLIDLPQNPMFFPQEGLPLTIVQIIRGPMTNTLGKVESSPANRAKTTHCRGASTAFALSLPDDDCPPKACVWAPRVAHPSCGTLQECSRTSAPKACRHPQPNFPRRCQQENRTTSLKKTMMCFCRWHVFLVTSCRRFQPHMICRGTVTGWVHWCLLSQTVALSSNMLPRDRFAFLHT